MLPGPTLRIGARTSPMANAQACHVARLLHDAGVNATIVGIETSGDRWPGAVADLGGKGAFLKEIDRSLLTGGIDVAVHCMKDVPGDQPIPDGTEFAAYLPREDVTDVVVFPKGSPYRSLKDLPAGARVGTSAVRRKAQILKHRPDLHVEAFRGNVNSRLARFDAEQNFDALILARAGLERIGLADRVGEVLPVDVMCPAVGAGVIGLQCRTADADIVELLSLLDHAPTRIHLRAERTMLHDLRGHCNSPIAGHCSTTVDGWLNLRGMVFDGEGDTFVYAQEWDSSERSEELGAYVAAALIRKGARQIIDGISH